MHALLSAAMILLFVNGIFGASVSVNVTDSMLTIENATLKENATDALNESVSIMQKTRSVDLTLEEEESANVTDVGSAFNSTDNSTSSMVERAIGDEELTSTVANSTTVTNTSNIEKLDEVKVERSESIENTTLTVNTTDEVVNNQTTRGVSVNETINSNVTRNGTENLWSALPLFRNMSSAIRNSSETSNSSQTIRQVASDISGTVKGNGSTASVDLTESTEKSDLEDSEGLLQDGVEDDVEDDVSTKKPCASLSCMISRGCSDESSCTSDN